MSIQRETEWMPWCVRCEAFSVPQADGTCGRCGTAIQHREGAT